MFLLTNFIVLLLVVVSLGSVISFLIKPKLFVTILIAFCLFVILLGSSLFKYLLLVVVVFLCVVLMTVVFKKKKGA